MLKHENTDVCRTWSTADAGVFGVGEVETILARYCNKARQDKYPDRQAR